VAAACRGQVGGGDVQVRRGEPDELANEGEPGLAGGVAKGVQGVTVHGSVSWGCPAPIRWGKARFSPSTIPGGWL